MKTVTNNNVKSTNLTSKNFTIKTCAKAFEILSSGLYKDKITSIVRELCSNAYDAHVAAGITSPIEVHFPTELDSNIYFIDHGIGMSEEQIMNMYVTYFDSDKTDTNEQIGGFGLGSKSPFSYTNSFMVTSSKDGMKKQFLCFVNEEGPQITKLKEEACNETGTTVSFVVKNSSDRDSFADAVNLLRKYNWDKEDFIKTNYDRWYSSYRVEKLNDKIDNVYKVSSYGYGYSDKPKARIGIFWYTIDPDLLDKEVGAFAKRLEGFLFDIKIGDVDLVASREEISYTKRTIDFLNNMLKSFKQQIADELKNTVESMSCKDFLRYVNKNSLRWLDMKEFGFFESNWSLIDGCNLLEDIEDEKKFKISYPVMYKQKTTHLIQLALLVKKESEKKTRFKEIVDATNMEPSQFWVISVQDDQYDEFIKSKWMRYFETYKSRVDALGEKEKTEKVSNKFHTSCYLEIVASTDTSVVELNKETQIVYIDTCRRRSYIPGFEATSSTNVAVIDDLQSIVNRNKRYDRPNLNEPGRIFYLSNAEKQSLLSKGYKLVNYFDWMIEHNKKIINRMLKMAYVFKTTETTSRDMDRLTDIAKIIGDDCFVMNVCKKYHNETPYYCERLCNNINSSVTLRHLLSSKNCIVDNFDVENFKKVFDNNKEKYKDILRLQSMGICAETKDLVLKLLTK